MDNKKYQTIQKELLDVYQKTFRYKIKDSIQEIDLIFDAERIKKEMLSFIADQGYGYRNISLRLEEDASDWDSYDKTLYDTGFSTCHSIRNKEKKKDTNPEEYVKWHTELPSDSYLYELTKMVEDVLGLNTFKVSLVWIAPNTLGDYGLHFDPEPCRIHIPLITNDRVYFITDEKIHKMKYGKAYHLLPTVEHTVINYGSTPRLHLIFSAYMSKEISEKMVSLADMDIVNENLLASVEKDSGMDTDSLNSLVKIELDSKDMSNSNFFSLDIFKIIGKHLKGKD